MMAHPHLRIGTRASPMALAMAETVKDALLVRRPDMQMSILSFVAEGDTIAGSLKDLGGKGTFIKDLERRLLAGEIDCAIHALKDIPGDLPPHEDLTLLAYMTREDPRDALVMRTGVAEQDLLTGGIIGTSSPRRCAAMKKLYPGIRIEICRGNVNSRLRKLDEGKYDAIVLAYAGLVRLGLAHRASRIYTADEVLPAVGQGILVIQVRKADIAKCPYLQVLNHLETQITAIAERAMLFRLQGNCHSAIAGHCFFLPQNILCLRGEIYNPDNGDSIKAEQQIHLTGNIDGLGISVADALLAQGALSFYSPNDPARGP